MAFHGMHPGYANGMPVELLHEHMMMDQGPLMGGAFQNNAGPMFPAGTGIDMEFNEVHSVMMDIGISHNGRPFGVSSLAFDTADLLWCGNQGGHVTSYLNLDLQKYTSFQAHMTDEVRQLITSDMGILILMQSQLRLSKRRGLTEFDFRHPSMTNMQCMMMTSPTSVLMGGHQTTALELDLGKQQIMNEFTVKAPGCAILRRSGKHVCAGDTSGKVTLYDPRTFKAEHVYEAHSGTLSDFDIHGNLLITCGFSPRMGNLTPDRLLMVYDLRVNRAMAPIQASIDPIFIRFIPSYANRLAVISQTGSFQLMETSSMTPQGMMLYQVSTNNMITSFEVSNSCEALAFGASDGYIHLFANRQNAVFNTYPHEIELPDQIEEFPHMNLDDEYHAMSAFPIFYPPDHRESMLSDWPIEFYRRVYRKPKPTDPDILRSFRINPNVGNHNVLYALNPRKERRNQIPYKMTAKPASSWHNPFNPVPESPLGRGTDPFAIIPKRYRRVEMKYSKFGLEDFDFRHYNKTNFAGLETHIPNAYCNSMLQVLYFIEPLRCSLLSHLCQRETCLGCELGFLFHMLDSQKGETCQASNFLRAFRNIPEASALGLLLAEGEENDPKVNLPRLIQSWQCFVLQQLHSETCSRQESPTGAAGESGSSVEALEKKENAPPAKSKKKKKKNKRKEDHKEDHDATDTAEDSSLSAKSTDEAPEEPTRRDEKSVISQLFGINTLTTLQCRCETETRRENDTTLINLSYPDYLGPNDSPIKVAFSEVLAKSMSSESTTQAWCSNCNRYQQHVQRRVVKNLPDILALNCQMEQERDFSFWTTQLQLLKQKEEEGGSPQASAPPAAPTVKMPMCRYGDKCTRPNCKFGHNVDSRREMKEDTGDAELTEEDVGQKWLPMGLQITLQEDGTVGITEIADDELLPEAIPDNTKHYELYAVICHIRDMRTCGHLVAKLKVGKKYHQRKERVTCTQWYLLNDFSITPIEKYEANYVNMEWCVPVVIYYIRRNIDEYHDLQVSYPIKPEILVNDTYLLNPKRRKMTFTPLQPDEIPTKGSLVALDAEFVSLKEEEAELRSDGTKSTIKPSHMSVARITCIRGESGPQHGVPFIDDYISTQEQVVDYLTQYSGIKHGDLDANVSSKHLTTLKSTYQKLRYLVDTGVIFIGHGLKKDFRVINICVPKTQVIDTVELYHLPRQRMISLKFLAWYFLKINIQSVTHDSVEDARTALMLYLKYRETQEEGGQERVETVIKELYEEGRKRQWVIPDMEEDETSDQTAYL